MQFDEVLGTWKQFFEREGLRYTLIGGMAMKNFPHRALFEGEDVRALLNVPGVDRVAIREYFASQGLVELYDAIEKAR